MNDRRVLNQAWGPSEHRAQALTLHKHKLDTAQASWSSSQALGIYLGAKQVLAGIFLDVRETPGAEQLEKWGEAEGRCFQITPAKNRFPSSDWRKVWAERMSGLATRGIRYQKE